MSQASQLYGITANLINAKLVEGTTSTYTTTVATECVIDGIYTTILTAQTNTATPTTDATTGAAFVALAASEACSLVFGVTAAGAIGVVQGPVVAMDADTDEPLYYPPFGDVDLDAICPIGYIIAKNGSTGSAWTFGTTNWTVTGMVAETAVNVATLPRRPQNT